MLTALRAMSIAILAVGFCSVAAAQGFSKRNLFFGGGVSHNEVSGSDSATGVQGFGGYTFGELAPKLHLDAEAGYMDSGSLRARGPQQPFSRARGPWATGVVRYLPAPNVELLARAGVDAGDDDGPMFGVGVGFIASRALKFRLEFVVRDDIDSLQFNVVVFPWR